jgi:hypothetical protein
MFNIFNIFKKSNPETQVNGTQNDVNDMKDELPLVNEGLLTEPTKMRIFSVSGHTSYEIGDVIVVNLTSGKADNNLIVDKYLKDRGIVKLYSNNGVVIKAIKI